MKKINSIELLKLPFGSVVKIIWCNSAYHNKNEEYTGVIFGKNIGYEDGKIDTTISIAECEYNNWCMVYKKVRKAHSFRSGMDSTKIPCV